MKKEMKELYNNHIEDLNREIDFEDDNLLFINKYDKKEIKSYFPEDHMKIINIIDEFISFIDFDIDQEIIYFLSSSKESDDLALDMMKNDIDFGFSDILQLFNSKEI